MSEKISLDSSESIVLILLIFATIDTSLQKRCFDFSFIFSFRTFTLDTQLITQIEFTIFPNSRNIKFQRSN